MLLSRFRSEAPCAISWQCELTNHRHKGLHMTFNQTMALAIVSGILGGLLWLLRAHRSVLQRIAAIVFFGTGAIILVCTGLNMAYSAGIRDGRHLVANPLPASALAAQKENTYLIPMWFFRCLFLLGGADGAIAVLETTLPAPTKLETKGDAGRSSDADEQ